MAGEAVEFPGDGVRAWAREAAQAGMSPAELAGELYSRWGIRGISAIMVLRDATGASLADAKGVVGGARAGDDAAPPAEFAAASKGLGDDLAESFMADVVISGARVRLCWDLHRSRWNLEVTSGRTRMGRDIGTTSPDSPKAMEETARIIGRLASRRGRALRVSWLDPAELAEGEISGVVEPPAALGRPRRPCMGRDAGQPGRW